MHNYCVQCIKMPTVSNKQQALFAKTEAETAVCLFCSLKRSCLQSKYIINECFYEYFTEWVHIS